jgi:hypothetical protein
MVVIIKMIEREKKLITKYGLFLIQIHVGGWRLFFFLSFF